MGIKRLWAIKEKLNPLERVPWLAYNLKINKKNFLELCSKQKKFKKMWNLVEILLRQWRLEKKKKNFLCEEFC